MEIQNLTEHPQTAKKKTGILIAGIFTAILVIAGLLFQYTNLSNLFKGDLGSVGVDDIETYYWSFDEGSGNSLIDNGDLKNNARLIPYSGANGWTEEGIKYGAFDLNKGYFHLGKPIYIEQGKPFTISSWINFDTMSEAGQKGPQSIITSNGNFVLVTWSPKGTKQIFGINIRMRDHGYGSYVYSSTGLTPNEWHNVVLTYDGENNRNSVNLYIDGAKEVYTTYRVWAGESPVWLPHPAEGNKRTVIGANADDVTKNRFLGKIDELKVIIGKAMTDEEVIDAYIEIISFVPPPPTYTVTYDGNGADADTAVPTSETKTHNTNLTLITDLGTLAKTGHTFSGWTTESNGSGTTYDLGGIYTENADVTLYAKWEINTYNLTYTAGEGGTITDNASQIVEHGGNGQAVTAIPDTGYIFSKWDDGEMDNTRTDTAVTSDITVTAVFVVEEPEIVEPEPVTCTDTAGTVREVGDTFDAGDDCNTCTCGGDGTITCTELSCEPEPVTCTHSGVDYAVGVTFPDDCNTCTCGEDGEVSCTKISCEPPTQTCSHGGVTYKSGDVMNLSECYRCQCVNGEMKNCTNICEEKTCTYNSKTYSPGAIVIVDSCNTCTCKSDGTMSCTNKTCEVPEVPKVPEVTVDPIEEPSQCLQIVEKRTFADVIIGEVKKAVEALSKLKVDNYRIVEGYKTSGGFDYKPNEDISRAEFGKILLYASSCEEMKRCNVEYSKTPLPKSKIVDIDPSEWFYTIVRCGVKNDIFYGNEKNEFRPDEAITRAEATEMIVKAAKINTSLYSGQSGFTDVKQTYSYSKVIQAAAEMKVIQGYPDGQFKPNNKITRGEAALIITRYLENQKN